MAKILLTIPVPGKEANAWPPWDLVLFGNASDLNWRWGNHTTTPTCLAGTSDRRHALRWQIWPNRSCIDGSRLGHPVLWKAIPRRRTLLGWGTWHHIHTIQEPSVGLASRPNLMPKHWACGKSGKWLYKPSPNDALVLEGQDIPILTHWHFCHSGLGSRTGPHWRRGFWVLTNMQRSLGVFVGCPTWTEGGHHNGAGTMARWDGAYEQHHPHHLCLYQITGLRVIKVLSQLPHQFLQGLTNHWAPDLHTVVNTTGAWRPYEN